MINRWFLSKDTGFYNINYAFKKHPELNEEFVDVIGNISQGGDKI